MVSLAVCLLLGISSALQASALVPASAQRVNTWIRAQKAAKSKASDILHQQVFETPKYPPYFFEQPVDHFSNDTTDVFGQRYWVNSKYYEEGGPVFVLDGGETSGEDRLPFLDHGILDILAKATNGLGIVLEHRYYGDSMPVSEFSTDSLRWLNNAQSMEDSAQFISNFKWNGTDLSAPKTKWIYYGGSYAGARSAHMRVAYPKLVHGAIASSAVTHAAINYWEYMDHIRMSADQTCISHLASAIAHIDKLLKNKLLNPGIKHMFKLGGLSDADFASVIAEPLGAVQAGNWDSSVGSDDWNRFCTKLGSGKANSPIEIISKRAVVLNYANWIKKEIVKECSSSVEECFGTDDDRKFQDISDLSNWRAWTWQVCNEWGYFIGAPPDPEYPTIVSRKLTLDYTSKICKQAFPAGKYAQIPTWPNVTAVNMYGDFKISANRLAFIDGDEDPWSQATPHSRYAPRRPDTISRPFKWIKTGIHHFDENGLVQHELEPSHIREIHDQEVEFVKAWLKEDSD